MPVYNLRFTDSSKDPIVVYPKSLDGPGANRQNTDLRLYGQGAELWGEGVAEDLLRLLENFASPGVGSPVAPDPTILANPIEGQMWMNQTDSSIYVYRPLETPQWRRMTQDGDAYTKAEADARYYERTLADAEFVQITGDTMTDGLVIGGQADKFKALHIRQDDTNGGGMPYIFLETQPSGSYQTTQPPVLMLYNPDNDQLNPGVPAANKYPYFKVTARDGNIFTFETNEIEDPSSASAGSPNTNIGVMYMTQGGSVVFNGISGDPTAVPVGLEGLGEVRAPYTNVAYTDSLTTKDYVDTAIGSAVPTGAILPYAGGSTPPTGFLSCINPSAVSRTTYADLFGVIGTTYGIGDGVNTFDLPQLAGRAAIGRGGIAAPNAGSTAGSETHTLTTSQMPVHNHSSTMVKTGSHTHSVRVRYRLVEADHGSRSWMFHNQSDPLRSGWLSSQGNHKHTLTINNKGSGSSHNNMQPSLAMNWIIKT